MSVHFEYIDNVTGKVVDMEEIDRELCEFQGVKVNKDEFCGAFMFLKFTGLKVLRFQGSGYITTLEGVKQYIECGGVDEEFSIDKPDLRYLAKVILTRFCGEKYTYSAWR